MKPDGTKDEAECRPIGTDVSISKERVHDAPDGLSLTCEDSKGGATDDNDLFGCQCCMIPWLL